VSRVFVPSVGINEDPVTGLAHSSLGLFWADRFRKKELTGFQLSRRTGTVKVKLEEDFILISGQAKLAFTININDRHCT
jgi:predicted PhzF superfamily epimerase YddE/YHI9